MVSLSELIRVISECLRKYKAKNIVVDPVMSGSGLIKTEAIETLIEALFPLANRKIYNEKDMGMWLHIFMQHIILRLY